MSKQQVRARLLDTLLSSSILPPLPNTDVTLDQKELFSHNAALRQMLGPATCIEATNVARFFDENYMISDTAGEALWTDLKCLVPPHRLFFIEWDKPRIPNTKRMGVLFVACDPNEIDNVADAMGLSQSTLAKIPEFRNDVRCRWIYLTMDFLEFAISAADHISQLRGPYNVGILSIAEDGALLNFWITSEKAITRDESLQIVGASLVAWTTLAMLNCANIDTVEHRAPDAFQKARVKSGKKPLVSYHTVKVDLDKTPRQVGAESLPGEAGTRLHKKRGHMKDYRKGKGLFGRYKGVWYWGPTLAGSEEEGVIVSDYEVKP